MHDVGSLVPPDFPVAGTHVCTKRLHIYLSWPTSTEFIHWLDYRKFHLALVCIMHVIRLASASSRCCWCCCCCRFCRCARGIVHLNNINKNEHTHTHRQMQSSPLQTKRSAFSRDFMRTPVNIYIVALAVYCERSFAWRRVNKVKFFPINIVSNTIYAQTSLYVVCSSHAIFAHGNGILLSVSNAARCTIYMRTIYVHLDRHAKHIFTRKRNMHTLSGPIWKHLNNGSFVHIFKLHALSVHVQQLRWFVECTFITRWKLWSYVL